MRIAIIGLIAIITTGCAGSNLKSFTGPDGKVMNTIKCSHDTNECFEKASTVCGGSYQVLDSHSYAGDRPESGFDLGAFSAGLRGEDVSAYKRNQAEMERSVTWYAMNIQCGSSDGKIPQFTFRGKRYSPPTNSITTHCTGYGNSVTCRTE